MSVPNLHYCSHFKKQKNSESPECYRKNINPFTVEQKTHRLTRNRQITEKIGRSATMTCVKFEKKEVEYLPEEPRLKPHKTLNGYEISIEKLKNYLKDLELFTRNRTNNKEDTLKRKSSKIGSRNCRIGSKLTSYGISTSTVFSNILERAEKQREERISMKQTNLLTERTIKQKPVSNHTRTMVFAL